MSPFARLAALHRELADVYDALADEQLKRPRQQRPSRDAAATDALRKVKDGLRRQGVRHGKAS